MNRYVSLADFSKILDNIGKRRHRIALCVIYLGGLTVGKTLLLSKREYVEISERHFSWMNNYSDYVPFDFGVRSLQKVFKKSLYKSDLDENITLSDLRKSCAVNLMRSGVKIRGVCRTLGFHNIKCMEDVLEYYFDSIRRDYEEELGNPIIGTYRLNNLGKNEKEILDRIEKEKGITITRSYPVSGFIVDGYDERNNVVYEVDEKYHERQKIKDKRREKIIKSELQCEIVRIKDYE